MDSQIVRGHDDEGDVLFQNEGKHLVVFVSESTAADGDIESETLLTCLVKELDIDKQYHGMLLKILVAKKDSKAVDILEAAKLKPYKADAVVIEPVEEKVVVFSRSENQIVDEEEALVLPETTAVAATAKALPVPSLSTSPGYMATPEPAVYDLPLTSAASQDSFTTLTRLLNREKKYPAQLSGMRATNGSSPAMAKKPALKRAHDSFDLPCNTVNGSILGISKTPLSATDGRPLGNVLPLHGAPQAGLPPRATSTPGTDVSDEANEYQQENGHKGEVIVSSVISQTHKQPLTADAQVYHFLTGKFQASSDCWTSALRIQYGHSEFNGFDGDFTDFTITGQTTVDKITQWLLDLGHTSLHSLLGQNITYRIEVKATAGAHDEPFSMSLNQYNQVC